MHGRVLAELNARGRAPATANDTQRCLELEVCTRGSAHSGLKAIFSERSVRLRACKRARVRDDVPVCMSSVRSPLLRCPADVKSVHVRAPLRARMHVQGPPLST